MTLSTLRMPRIAMRALSAAAALAAGAALAQTPFPAKPVRLVVGFPPGGGSDILARAVAPEIAEALGQPIVIDNKPGAGGMIANEMVTKAAPDGYTLLLTSSGSISILPHLGPKIAFDPIRDFTAVGPFALNTFALAVHPSVNARTIGELLALARQSPGALNYGSAGNGSIMHLATGMLESMAGVKMTHVPYKGAPQGMQDLITGRIQLMFNTIGITLPQAKDGRLRVIGVSTLKRSALLPDVPTIDESGVKGFDVSNWFGVFGPAGIPRPVVERLNAINKALARPTVLERLRAEGAEATPGTADSLDRLLHADYEKYGKLVKTIGLKIE